APLPIVRVTPVPLAARTPPRAEPAHPTPGLPRAGQRGATPHPRPQQPRAWTPAARAGPIGSLDDLPLRDSRACSPRPIACAPTPYPTGTRTRALRLPVAHARPVKEPGPQILFAG